MSKLVKFFSKKHSSNKENRNDSLKRVNFERSSTRSDTGVTNGVSEAQREQELRAIANPYSVWTEPKKPRGPASCPGVVLDSDYYNERCSVRPTKQQRRAGSVYGDAGSLKHYRIDDPSESGSRAGSSHGYHHVQHHQQQQHFTPHHNSRSSSRRYGGDLSMIEERSERSSNANQSMAQQYGGDWSRSSHRRAHSVLDYTSGESEEEDDSYVRRLEEKCQKLYDEKRRYRERLENKKNELEYFEYQLKQELERNSEMERKYSREMEKLRVQLEMERERTEILEKRLSEMSSSTSNGVMERLVSSSETSLECEDEGTSGTADGSAGGADVGDDEVRNFRGCDSSVGGGSSTAAAAAAAAANLSSMLHRGMRVTDDCELVEMTRREQVGRAASPLFELRRSASDMGPSTVVDGAGEEMAVMEGGVGGSWRRQRDRRRSFVKRPMLAAYQESESSDGEKILLTERQLRKKGSVVKFDPNRRVSVKEKHYRRFGKPERSALDRFTFLEHEVTDISGMLSSPNEGNY